MWNYFIIFSGRIAHGVKAGGSTLLFSIFAMLVFAIWWFGPKLVINGEHPLAPMLSRGLAIAVLALIFMAIWGIWQWRKLASLRADNQRETERQVDPIKRLEEQQGTELDRAMSQLEQAVNKPDYHYTLPWYVVLGASNAGKSSLLYRSGERFNWSPLQDKMRKKTLAPYTVDWWISDQAVMVEPAGEMINQQNGESEDAVDYRLWQHFLGWLETTRERQPLNGAILAVDLQALASASVSERQAQAQMLRARLAEVVEKCSTRLPVYVVLTKVDLLEGFEAYFRHYTPEQRKALLGFSFDLEGSGTEQWLAEFEDGFSGLVCRINALLPEVMQGSNDANERAAMFSFARQMAGLLELLTQYLADMLHGDDYNATGRIRGVYLTSVYQQGVPSNVFVDEAARQFGIDLSVNTAYQQRNSTTYFVHKLFNKAIFPEAGLANSNAKVKRQHRRLVGMTMLTGAIATAILGAGWHQYYHLNRDRGIDAQTQLTKTKEGLEKAPLATHMEEAMAPLTDLYNASLAFGVFDDMNRFSDWGLYQGHLIGPEIEEAYLTLLETHFLPNLLVDVVGDLLQARNDDDQLHALRVFKMLTDKRGRREQYVRDHFAKRWQRSYRGDREAQDVLMMHLDRVLAMTDVEGRRQIGDLDAIRLIQPYDNIVHSTQRRLGTLSTEERLYTRLKEEAERALGASMNVKTSIGPVFDLVFDENQPQDENLQIPRLLTESGLEQYLLSSSEQILEWALIDSWVLGQTEVSQFSQADKMALQQAMYERYANDYIVTWREAINGVDIKYFADINEAAAVLEQITGKDAPLQRLLDIVSRNTRLMPILPEDEEARKAMLQSGKYRLAANIDVPFSEINAISETQSGKPSYAQEVMTAVFDLHTYISKIHNSPDRGQAALEAAKARVKLLRADPIYTLQQIAVGLPAPLDQMVQKLADESWYVIKQEAAQHLEYRWRREVYREYSEKLANRYPFNAASTKDASLKDFENFFAPDGVLEEFYQQELKPFVEQGVTVGDQADSYSMIRRDVLNNIRSARKIRQAFFNRKGILDVEFTLETMDLSSNKLRSLVNVDGQFVEYSHGPKNSVELVWPNTLRDSAYSKLTLVPTNSSKTPKSISIQGPWAFFRLLEKAKVVGASETSVDYRFEVAGGEVTYRLRAEADSNPFTMALFKSFRLSRSLY